MAHLSIGIRWLAIVCFLSFMIVAISLGGEALTGRVENGQHFLSWHGQYTEVPAETYAYSRFHGIASFILIPLATLSVLLSKPSKAEAKWQGHLILVGIISFVALSYYKYGA